MSQENIKIIGINELQEAIKRSPKKVLEETQLFLVRGMTEYKSGIINNPWRMGGGGGGVPVSNDQKYYRKYQKSASGNLRDTHQTEYQGLEARIFPTAPYASYVHGLEGFPRKRKYQLRPWLDYVRASKDKKIESLYTKLLENIVGVLAK